MEVCLVGPEHDFQEMVEVMVEAFHYTQSKYGGLPEDLAEPPISSECLRDILEEHNKTLQGLSSPYFYRAFVAVDKKTKQILGFNAVGGEGRVGGVGPLAVKKEAMGKGVGRLLMKAVLDSCLPSDGSEEKRMHPFRIREGITSVRLVVNAHNPVAQSLYISLGFDAKMHLAVMCGLERTPSSPIPSLRVRRMQISDFEECCKFQEWATGVTKSCQLLDAIEHGEEWERAGRFNSVPYVVVKETLREDSSEEIVGFTVGLHIEGSCWGRNEEAIMCLLQEVSRKYTTGEGGVARESLWKKEIDNATAEDLPYFFVDSIRNPALLRWCLASGFRLLKSMNHMSVGEYQPIQVCVVVCG